LDQARVSLTIHPSGGDDQPLNASDFLKQVDSLRQLLTMSAAGGEEPRILRLQMNSPATVVLEAAARNDIGPFFNGLREIALKGTAPEVFDRPVFEAFRDFAGVIGRGVRTAVLETYDYQIEIDVAARRNIESVFGADTSSEGTVDGMLEAINIHSKTNTFALYPVVGAARVNCKFSDEMLPLVKPALGKYVVIQGELKFRWRERYPHEARAVKIEILPDWDEQPKFEDILGMAPLATGKVPSEEFVRNIRSGWN
jgi:hypothetical protein